MIKSIIEFSSAFVIRSIVTSIFLSWKDIKQFFKQFSKKKQIKVEVEKPQKVKVRLTKLQFVTKTKTVPNFWNKILSKRVIQ
jgi:hypothetical protein